MGSRSAYITCTGKTDGIGAQAIAIISTLLFARGSGLQYLHTPFKKIAHNYDDDPEWEQKWERFFNLGSGELQFHDLHGDSEGLIRRSLRSGPHEDDLPLESRAGDVLEIGHCLKYADCNPDLFTFIRADLRKRYHLTPKIEVRRDGVLILAMHVRRGDVSASAARFTSNRDLSLLLSQLESMLGKVPFEVHLFSQGSEDDFPEFSGRVIFHLDENPFQTFQWLVGADILITAKSTFSYTAAILSQGTVIYFPFWHRPMWNWLRVDRHGAIRKTDLLRSLARRSSSGAKKTAPYEDFS